MQCVIKLLLQKKGGCTIVRHASRQKDIVNESMSVI